MGFIKRTIPVDTGMANPRRVNPGVLPKEYGRARSRYP